MKLHELRPPQGSRQTRQRVGRGMSAGQGKTSGRGQKGQGARTMHLPVGFEGGQMRLSQRLPKLRGFHNRFRTQYAVVNLSKLNRFESDSVIDPGVLGEAGLLPHRGDRVKVLGAGELKVRLSLRVHAISASARHAVEARGGSVELIETVVSAADAAAVAGRAAHRRDSPRTLAADAKRAAAAAASVPRRT